VNGPPSLVGYVILVGVGLSPILSFWLLNVLGRFLRRKPLQRPEIRSRMEGGHARDEPEREARSG
jgi:hypothetical protein